MDNIAEEMLISKEISMEGIITIKTIIENRIGVEITLPKNTLEETIIVAITTEETTVILLLVITVGITAKDMTEEIQDHSFNLEKDSMIKDLLEANHNNNICSMGKPKVDDVGDIN